MNTTFHHESAKIYQFPRKTRVALGQRQPGKGGADFSQQVPCVDCGGGWYHEAAVQAERPRKS